MDHWPDPGSLSRPHPITLDNASMAEIKERARRRIAELKRNIQNNKDDLKKLQLELDEWQRVFEPVTAAASA